MDQMDQMMRRLFCLTAAAALSSAMAADVTAPSMGYVVSPDGLELRAMLGVPGAARFSAPIALPEGTVAAEVAPGHAWVLAKRSNGLVAFQPADGTVYELAAALPASWAFSPMGARMALWYPDRGEVVLLNGLPENAKIVRTVKLAEAPDSLALSDAGAFVFTAGNRILDSGGGLIFEGASSVAFETGGDLLVASNGSSVVEINIGDGGKRLVTEGLDGVDRLFADGKLVYAGNSAAGLVSLIGLADRSVTSRNVAVSRIIPSAMQGTVLVSYDMDGPAWLVNGQGVSFVPAVVR